MAPKGQKKKAAATESQSLSSVAFTEEEIKEAKETLKQMNPKETTSRMASMVYFMKQVSDETGQASRGDLRQEYLVKFVAHQMKTKKKTGTQENSSTVENLKQKGKKWFRWSKEKMQKELGPKKCEAWIDCNLLPTRACPLTKATSEFLIEYAVPFEWESIQMSDLEKWKITVETTADEKDKELMDIFRSETGVDQVSLSSAPVFASPYPGWDLASDGKACPAAIVPVKRNLFLL